MSHRMLQDPESSGWERSDFPIVCETCLGPNPYVRMQKIEYGAECHISKRPYTKFRWRPGNDARYKATIICQQVAKAKNVCQVCLLDLSHSLPVQVRDQLTNAVIEDIPESEVGLEFQLARKEAKGELGAQFKDEKANESILRLARTTPYYKRNRAHICSFFVRGECTRGAECPYRHEMPETGELADQNIRDRYYGINDPVARKMLRRLGERVQLEPPEDKSICTLYVGNVEPDWKEADVRAVFAPHGRLAKVKVVHGKSCAFVTFATRKEAEAAADKLHDALIIHGTRCKLLWGKPQATAPAVPPEGDGAAAAQPDGEGNDGGRSAAAAAPAGPPDFFAMPRVNYPSMDPDLMGSRGTAAPPGPTPPAASGGPPASMPDLAAAPLGPLPGHPLPLAPPGPPLMMPPPRQAQQAFLPLPGAPVAAGMPGPGVLAGVPGQQLRPPPAVLMPGVPMMPPPAGVMPLTRPMYLPPPGAPPGMPPGMPPPALPHPMAPRGHS